MSAKGIREYDGKRMIAHHLGIHYKAALIDLSTNSGVEQAEYVFSNAVMEHPWLATESLVVKPDQLVKRRGKNGLILLDADWTQVKEWIVNKASKPFTIGKTVGELQVFLVEPFVKHDSADESYLCIRNAREGDEVLYCNQGGVDVGDVDAKALRHLIPLEYSQKTLPGDLAKSLGLLDASTAAFVAKLYEKVYVPGHFTLMEINPLVKSKDSSNHVILDLAAKVDQTAEYEAGKVWAAAASHNNPRDRRLHFPAPFGHKMTQEEAFIAEMDEKTGASLKLTVLNPAGRIWTMVAGGGASVAYTDAICALGFASDLANYGEYSGAPSETQTYEYAKTVLSLLTRNGPHPLHQDRILFIGGGIANFTNVATTFKGIIRAIREAKDPLKACNTRIFVRRGGPNWQEGLKNMKNIGLEIGLGIKVYGPETHITAIVPMALKNGPELPEPDLGTTLHSQPSSSHLLERYVPSNPKTILRDSESLLKSPIDNNSNQEDTSIQANGDQPSLPVHPESLIMHRATQCFVYGIQMTAIQGMLDFDFISRREKPSVVAIIYGFSDDGRGPNESASSRPTSFQRFYWGTHELILPIYANTAAAAKDHPHVDFLVNFASHRSVYETCMEALEISSLKTIAVIAEGVPERRAREIAYKAKSRSAKIIGPATVGGLRAGAFRIGYTAGMLDNVLSARLYRPGSFSYVSRSGGMSNELNNLLSLYTDGVCEGIAIGGDRWPGSGFLEHLMRFEQDPSCHVLVLLGEVGGVEEYGVCEALAQKRITKPLIAWCIGIAASLLADASSSGDIQFGHAGACAGSIKETATSKNAALKAAGALVPDSFEELPLLLGRTFEGLVSAGVIRVRPEPDLPLIPVDYSWAHEIGLIRKPPSSFISTICDDRGQELLYAGMPITAVFKEDLGLGGVISLLWFRRRLPPYACKFIEMVLMLTADHGPAVSGAHNAIVTARAGKDLVSSLCSGLLTIGDRFGGASDAAAADFALAHDSNTSPEDFVANCKRQHKLIQGIGHRIKSVRNPDMRVTILCDYAEKHFPSTSVLQYARAVERITTSKKENLILNVDGAIGVLFVDLIRGCGAFTPSEADDYWKQGALTALFVLGRSIGFIGHYLDQRRLKQGLYRHPWDDISYLLPNMQYPPS